MVAAKITEKQVSWEVVGCDLCGSDRNTVFMEGRLVRSDGSRPMQLVRCSGCGLVYLNPRPDQESIGVFYAADYYAHSGLKSRQRTIRAKLRDRFLQGLGGYGTALDTRIIHRLAPIGLVDVILPESCRGRLLDVGCGDGERADWYRQRGFDVYGVELSSTGAANASKLGLRVHQGTLSTANYPDQFFDAVVMAHVLEHTHSPKSYLTEAWRILKPGGILAVAVPNIESHSADIFGPDWAFLMLPIHLYHFSVTTLMRYLSLSGFSVDSVVGKLVYPRMVRRSCKSTKANGSFSGQAKAWLSSGVIPSGVAYLRNGVSKCDTITLYCTRPKTD